MLGICFLFFFCASSFGDFCAFYALVRNRVVFFGLNLLGDHFTFNVLDDLDIRMAWALSRQCHEQGGCWIHSYHGLIHATPIRFHSRRLRRVHVSRKRNIRSCANLSREVSSATAATVCRSHTCVGYVTEDRASIIVTFSSPSHFPWAMCRALSTLHI